MPSMAPNTALAMSVSQLSLQACNRMLHDMVVGPPVAAPVAAPVGTPVVPWLGTAVLRCQSCNMDKASAHRSLVAKDNNRLCMV